MNEFCKKLNEKMYDFEQHMTCSEWDKLDIYEDDGYAAISAFIGFCMDTEKDEGGNE